MYRLEISCKGSEWEGWIRSDSVAVAIIKQHPDCSYLLDEWDIITSVAANSTIHLEEGEEAIYWYTNDGWKIVKPVIKRLRSFLKKYLNHNKFELRIRCTPTIYGEIAKDDTQIVYPRDFTFSDIKIKFKCYK